MAEKHSLRRVGYFVENDSLMLVINKHGHRDLARKRKNGVVPKGALEFRTRKEAETELRIMQDTNWFPLFSPDAKVVEARIY